MSELGGRVCQMLSVAGANFIKGFEKLALAAYRKGNDVPTIGWGHTLNVKLGDTCTLAQAEQWFDEDTAAAQAAVRRLVLVPLTGNQYDALVSFTFNCGIDNLRTSTLLRKLNLSDYAGAADEFPKWVFSHGVKLGGLLTRRTAERRIFVEGVYDAVH